MNDHGLNALLLFLQIYSPDGLKGLKDELKEKQAALGGGAAPVAFDGFEPAYDDDDDDGIDSATEGEFDGGGEL